MGKKIITFLILIISASRGYYISSFESQIRLQPNSTLEITECISVDFQDEIHHGIFRDIPYKYRASSGIMRNLRISAKSVTDENGNPRPYRTSKAGRHIHIRIGNPNAYAKGIQIYVIKYVVDRAINFFNTHDELWWEVTGHEWLCAIERASAVVILPEGTGYNNFQMTCYTGEYGSKDRDCRCEKMPDGISFNSGYLAPFEGLSIVVGIPKDIIEKPSFSSHILWFIRDNWFAVLTISIPFIVLALILRKWRKHGRDKGKQVPIVVRYSPPKNITPAQLGTIIDERADIRDIAATIIDLAIRGIIKIVEFKPEITQMDSTKDYAIVQLRDYKKNGILNKFERTMLTNMFEIGGKSACDLSKFGIFDETEYITISSLRNRFHSKLPKLQALLYGKLVGRKFFTGNPEKIRNRYKYRGEALILIGLIQLIFLFWLFPYSLLAAWAFVVSGIVYFLASGAMPGKTVKGVEAALYAQGLKEFIVRAEENRIRKLSEEDPATLGRILSFAIALGCADEWMDKIGRVFEKPPDWFIGTKSLTTTSFASGLGNAIRSINHSITSVPQRKSYGGYRNTGTGYYRSRSSAFSRSSGFSSGGFSGGGFGGGGGGAW